MKTQAERPNTVAGLIEKRALLAGKLKHLETEVRQITRDLDHLDATIRLFDKDANIGRVTRYPVQHRAPKGETLRLIIKMMRAATTPLTSFDITKAQMSERGLDVDDEAVRVLRKRVGSALYLLHREGKLREVRVTGPYKGWEWVR